MTDGSNSAILDFNGSYTLANFKFANDGNGGTIVYDPPVSNSLAAGTRPVTADHSNDAFLFDPNLGETASTDHAFETDAASGVRRNSRRPRWRSCMTHMRT